MSDVEPGPPNDQSKEGGLKDPKAKPQPQDDAAEVDIETEEDANGSRSGGMIGEG